MRDSLGTASSGSAGHVNSDRGCCLGCAAKSPQPEGFLLRRAFLERLISQV